jgi:5,10-methylenetetrahydromethanopterin reductase
VELVADSQNLNAYVWVELALAGAATERIGLGTGVTNTLTRHPAVTASAAATLQAETGGRAVLGLGRGDTALSEIGRSPVSTATLEAAFVVIQGLLHGDEVELPEGARSRIRWVADDGWPKVPLAVAATGPRVIAAAARHAERIDFTVGAEPERIERAIDAARFAADGRELSLGAYLNHAVHEDRRVARELVRGAAGMLAAFGGDSPGSAPDDFVDRFALAGPAEEVVERLRTIAALGIDRVIVLPGSPGEDRRMVEENEGRLATEVLPRLAS